MIEVIPNWHPFIVHFSIAPLSMSTALFLSVYIPALSKIQKELLITAKWCLYIGVFSTVLTVGSGWQAYGSVAHDAAGHAAMSLHRSSALVTLSLYLTVAVLFIRTQMREVNHWFIVLLLIANSSLGVTGYLGAENVYRHGIGVKRVPEAVKSIDINHDQKDQKHQH